MELEQRQSRLVFVDPEDESLPYWWPALIVTEEEFEMFHDTMDSDISQVNQDESSVVPFSAMVPFIPDKEPFLSYSRNIRRFISDLGVMRAVKFWNDGEIPDGFKWLKREALGSLSLMDPLPEKLLPNNEEIKVTTTSLRPRKYKTKPKHKRKTKLKVGKKRLSSSKNSLKLEIKNEEQAQVVFKPRESNLIVKLPEPKQFAIIGHLLPPNLLYTFL